MNYCRITDYFGKSRRLKYWASSTILIILGGLLAACGDNTATTIPPTTIPATAAPATTLPPTTAPATTTPAVLTAPATTNSPATPASTSGAIPDEVKKPFEAASNDLAKRASLAPQTIQMVSYNFEDFPDSSLGCPQPNTRYLQVITPGYRIQLEAGGQQYDYRTNVSGTRVVLCTNPGGLPRPVNTTP
jgi:hypothetical protein